MVPRPAQGYLAGMGQTAPRVPSKGSRPSTLVVAMELSRPLVFLALFVALDARLGPLWGAPFALATFFAAAVLVHDLIHNAYSLPRRLNELALAFFSLFIIKSGHALRRLHLEHHARCLEDDDREGNVVHIATWKLLLTGPWLALQARVLSFRKDDRTRSWQVIETLLDVVVVVALIYPWWRSGEYGPALYLAIVFVNTWTIPIFGAKVPHLLPERAPWLVAKLRPLATRLTPAASSLLFHELHHRRPRIPAPLLPAHADLLETTDRSNCEETHAAHAAQAGPAPEAQRGSAVS